MPVNRNALIRYRTIDQCLQNRMRTWTIEDLVEACSDALYEYEGIDKGVSKRTVQADIQVMRSEKLGYNAPIIVIDKKYYTYEDPDYSITNIPLTIQDLGKLHEVVEILKQFKGFSHFKELTGIVQRIEEKIYRSQSPQSAVIDFEKNEDLRGLEYIETLYQSILHKKSLEISYQPFKAPEPNTFVFHPYLLKEYRNRWFVLGVRDQIKNIFILALDRILEIKASDEILIENTLLDTQNYFRDVIGVSVSPNQPVHQVILWINADNAPYVLTKPLHQSQQILEKNEEGMIISLKVQLNFELEREILGFGETARVIAPQELLEKIKGRLEKAAEGYL
ncbi:MAG: WYL domain-containing protein [Microscillaceae bacterium]|nr:WYL domain-containing protein [Microscillaceae bacterium]